MNKQLVSLETLAHKINEQQASIEQAWGVTLERAKEAGELLIEAKRLAGHGNWLPWLETNCRVSNSMAEKYMKIAKGWDTLIRGETEHVPNLSIRDAVKLLAKPRKQETKEPPIIEVEYTEVKVDEPVQIQPTTTDTEEGLLNRLEAVLLDIPIRDRGNAVEDAVERLYAFKDLHCDPQTTLTKLRESFPGVPARVLRKEVADFISQWQYAKIRRDDKGRDFIKTEWAEDFIRRQIEQGWRQGEPLYLGLDLSYALTSTTKPILP